MNIKVAAFTVSEKYINTDNSAVEIQIRFTNFFKNELAKSVTFDLFLEIMRLIFKNTET